VGIFTTIGAGTLAAGPGVVVSFLLSGSACVFVSLCYAELASMVPIAGSAYTYAYATLGELVAWIIGWDLILEYGISVAPVGRGVVGLRAVVSCNFGVSFRSGDKSRTSRSRTAAGSISRIRRSICLASLVVLVITALLAIGIKRIGLDEHVCSCWCKSFRSSSSSLRSFGAIHPSNFTPGLFPRGLARRRHRRGARLFRLHRFRHGDGCFGRSKAPGARCAARRRRSLLIGAHCTSQLPW
jgi:hypothetical protein